MGAVKAVRSLKVFAAAVLAACAIALCAALPSQAWAATSVGSAAELNAALADSGVAEIELTDNISASETFVITKSVTINGNGKTITSSADCVIEIKASNLDVTLSNLNIVSSADQVDPYDIRGISVPTIDSASNTIVNTKVTLNNCSVAFDEDDANWAVYAVRVAGNNNTLDVNGGTYEGTHVFTILGTGHATTIDDATLTCICKEGGDYGFCIQAPDSPENVEVTNTTLEGDNARPYTNGAVANYCTDNTVCDFQVDSLSALKLALADAKAGDTITLSADITSSEIIVIDKPITLEGNGKKISSSADRAINVSTDGDVTIKNLVIEASGQRAINVIQKPVNLTLDNVAATAKNYAVNVAASAGAAKVAINSSDLVGLSVINVGADGVNMTVKGTNITCKDANENENYGAITIIPEGTNSNVAVTGGVVYVNGDSKAAVVYPKNSDVTFSGTTFEGTSPDKSKVSYIVAMVGDYGFDDLQDAIDYVIENGLDTPIVIVRDVEIDEPLVVPEDSDVVVDLNGNDITLSTDDPEQKEVVEGGEIEFVDKSEGEPGEVVVEYVPAQDDQNGEGKGTVIAQSGDATPFVGLFVTMICAAGAVFGIRRFAL